MLFSETIYIKIQRNSITVRNVNSKLEASGIGIFSTARLLVGTFSEAERLIKELRSQVAPKSFFRAAHVAVVHPGEMIEGGLSQVEERIFAELALGTGARKFVVHVGDAISDDGVLALARSLPRS
ncbi:MAG: hypothetical protein V4857_03370 [Pseudomonadota bacterium]